MPADSPGPERHWRKTPGTAIELISFSFSSGNFMTAFIRHGFLHLGLSAALLLLAGCGGNKEEKKPDDEGEKHNSLETARDLLHRATEVGLCREGTKMMNKHLSENADAKAELLKTGEDPASFQKLLDLSRDEVDSLRESSYTMLDAHHVAWCNQMRSIATMLRAHKLPPLKRAEVAFSWVNRYISLNTNAPENVPSPFVLKQGHGTANQRALIFLALLRQMDLTGCLITIPDSGQEKLWIPGVLIEDATSPNIYLFDTRLGMPLPGPRGKGVATLDELRNNPDSLKRFSAGSFTYDVPADQIAKAKLYLVCPLPSLSPRMGYLEGVLKKRGPVRLAWSPNKTKQHLEDAFGETIHFWTDPRAETGGLSPIRGLVRFLPPTEGGRGSPLEFQSYQSRLIYLLDIFQHFKELEVFQEIPLEARESLLQRCLNLVHLYYLEPRDKLIRGDLESIPKKVVKIENILKEVQEAIDVKRDENPNAFREEIDDWRKQVNAAFAARNNNEPDGQAKVNALWHGDLFLNQLFIRQDEEVPLNPKDRTMLSYLVLSSVAKPLREESPNLLALCWLEKALVLQSEFDLFQANWLVNELEQTTDTALDWCERYSWKNSLAPAAVQERLAQLQKDWSDFKPQPLAWDHFFRSMQEIANMELQRIDSLHRFGETAQAQSRLDNLATHLQDLRQNPQLKFRMELAAKEVERDFPNHQGVQKYIEALGRNLQDDGSFAWYSHAVALRKEIWNAKN
jgi:hypothetical protein